MSQEKNNNKPKPHDLWYKLRSIGGISTAIAAALITAIGSCVVTRQQAASNRIHLYTQLMSEQEKAENEVRRDMFKTILDSFLGEQQSGNDGCIIDAIDRQLLELEIISRNFHETMDLKPLFIHVLINIIREIPDAESILDNLNEHPEKPDECTKKMLCRLLKKESFKDEQANKKELIKEHMKKFKKKRLRRLNQIASRITSKQLESLSDVMMRMRYEIDLSKTCTDIPPSHSLEEEDRCAENENIDITDTLELENGSKRQFTISVERAYPKWNQVRIKITTNRLKDEIEKDPAGGPTHTIEFWVGFFDFPLIDNTYLSSKERYAVIIDDIDEKKAVVSLLYFPASYAGFKEKSYYEHRAINLLLKENNEASD